MRRSAGIWGRALLVCWLSCSSGSCTSEAFQADADVYRLRHLQYYAGLIEEYRAMTGRVPLQGTDDGWLWVYVSHDGQLDHIGTGPNYEHTRASFAEWVRDVEEVLGREIDERYEPQEEPYRRPLAYTYTVIDDAYYFTVPLHRSYAFTRELGPDYHAVTIGNYPAPTNNAVDPEELFASPEFVEALGRSASKPGFFEEREKQYRRHTKGRRVPDRVRVASREEQLGPLEEVCENTTPSESVSEAAASPLGLLASEYWLLLNPSAGTFIFREYDLRAGPDSSGSVASTGREVARLVESGDYPVAEFGFQSFTTLRTSVYPERGFITSAHLLHTDERRLYSLIEDSFERVLRRPVSVTISDGSIGVRFRGTGLRVADNNSRGVFVNGDDLVVCFRNGASQYEMVVTQVGDTSGVTLQAGIPDTVLFEAVAVSR